MRSPCLGVLAFGLSLWGVVVVVSLVLLFLFVWLVWGLWVSADCRAWFFVGFVVPLFVGLVAGFLGWGGNGVSEAEWAACVAAGSWC